MRGVALRAALATFVTIAAAQASDYPIAGSKLLIQNPSTDAARRKVVVTGVDGPASAVMLAGDPTASGATLRIVTTGATGADQTFLLPAAGWQLTAGTRFKYTNAATGGAVRSCVLRRTRSGVVRLKTTLRGRDGAIDVVPPNPGDSALVVLAIAGADTYCVGFGGAAGGTPRRNDALTWLVRSAVASACPAAPETTTTTGSTTTETTSTPASTTTATESTTTSTSTTTASTTTTTTTSTTESTTSTTETSTTTSVTTTSTTTTSTTTTTTTTSTTTTTTTTTTTSTTTTTTTSTTTTTTSTTTTTTTSSTTTTTTVTTSSSTTTTETTTSTVTSTTSTSTTTTSTTTTTTTTSSTTTSTTLVVEVNLLYVHGLKSCQTSRQNAQNTLVDLESAVNAALPARIAVWEATHPGVHVVARSARANVYTAPPSGIHPSDSTDPLLMDDWEVGDPGCSTSQQGDPCTTAYEWRFRLAEEVNRLYPAPMRNVILIGHSNGARAAMEVAANLGTGGVGTHDWGVQDRIAGVVTVQGVIDDIGSSKYDVVGISSFESSCKFGDAISGFGDSCAPGNGFCEWVARVDASPAADWVADHKRALMLTSWGSCSPSAWSGQSDGSLPYDAQASPKAVGLDMTPAPGQTWREAHGQRYGAFCHSDITDASKPNHAAARDAARNRILDWLFVAAPKVAATGTSSTPSIGFNQSTSTFTMGPSCGTGEVDDTITQGTKGAGIDVVGVCHHPGFFDGDDHAIALSEFTVTNGATCNGTYRWTQAHDSSNNHAANFWWKTRSLRGTAPELVGTLPTD